MLKGWGGANGASLPLVNESCVRGGASFYLSSLLIAGPAQTAGPPSFLPSLFTSSFDVPLIFSRFLLLRTVKSVILHSTDFIYFIFPAVKNFNLSKLFVF